MTANHYCQTLQNLHTKISNRQPGNPTDGIILLHNGALQSTGPTECHVMRSVQASCILLGLPWNLHIFGSLKETALKVSMFILNGYMPETVVLWFRQHPKEFLPGRICQPLKQME
jgi:hypothetical protein